jgi:RNA 3'-terminal phosphate cyclase (ATP)
MVAIDGSVGGGQVLRTALTLSVLEGEPLEMTGIRSERPEPGLKRQHLTALQAAARVADADVEGATHGSTDVAVDPGELRGGAYEVDIGTAGSLTLLFDVFLPLATAIDEPLSLSATGGTDVKWSPPLAAYRHIKLPLLREHGVAAAVEPGRTGFYPAGDGRATLHLWPSTPTPFDLGAAGTTPTPDVRIYSKASTDLADADVAERQAHRASTELARTGLEPVRQQVTDVETASPGSSIVIALDGPGLAAGFDAYGERGTPAEDVADAAIADMQVFRQRGGAVDVHLADQLLVFLALGGGRIAIPQITDHVRTCLTVLDAFGYDLEVNADRSPPVIESG